MGAHHARRAALVARCIGRGAATARLPAGQPASQPACLDQQLLWRTYTATPLRPEAPCVFSCESVPVLRNWPASDSRML
eukprot:350933-Chlamydomonas_euryale.AAC.1